MTVASIVTNISEGICEGETYFFNNVYLTGNGTYRDTLASSGSCDSIIVLTLTVFSKPSPVVIKRGNDTLTTSVPFISYQWLRNGVNIDSATSRTYIATQNGSYSVVVTDGNGCTNTSAAVTLQSVSINDIPENALISLYPNPTSGNFNIRIEGIEGRLLEIRLYDVYGNLVRMMNEEASAVQYSTNLNLGEYASGTYFIQLQFNDRNITRRIELVK